MTKQKAVIAALGAIGMFSLPGLSQAVMPSIANDAIVVQREAGEGPRGGDNGRPGDRYRDGGNGLLVDYGKLELAREAGERPRGGDNERPGDRYRRGASGLLLDFGKLGPVPARSSNHP